MYQNQNVLILLSVAVASIAFYFSFLKSPSVLTEVRSTSSRDQVQLKDGRRQLTYIGTSLDGRVETFQGIYYAQTTADQNRFRAPQPLAHAAGSIIDATTSGAWCPQALGQPLPFHSKVSNISENCLSLSIARPRHADKVPVVVYQHGGGHVLGSGSDIVYDGTNLVRGSASSKPVIFVSFNYRLGVFGFAVTPELASQRQLNNGLKDQRLALTWIQDNIAAFGGDPDRITVIGQSVGAADAGVHLLDREGYGSVPFHKAVMASGAPATIFNIDSTNVAKYTENLAKDLGCTNLETQCLRSIDMEVLNDKSIAMARGAHPKFGEGFFQPVVDGDYILDRPSEMLRQGRYHKGMPIIASWTRNDGAWYPSPDTSSDSEVLASLDVFTDLSAKSKQRLLALYPVEDFPEQPTRQYQRAARMHRDLWFTCPVVDFITNYESDNLWLSYMNATRFQPAWDAQDTPFWQVAHESDIPYLLNEDVRGGDNSPEQRRLAEKVSSALLDFVYDEAPWPRAGIEPNGYHLQGSRAKVWDLHGGDQAEGLGTSDLPEEMLERRCGFWNSEEVRRELGV